MYRPLAEPVGKPRSFGLATPMSCDPEDWPIVNAKPTRGCFSDGGRHTQDSLRLDLPDGVPAATEGVAVRLGVDVENPKAGVASPAAGACAASER